MKQRGKNAAMRLDDSSRFDTMHSVLEKQRQLKKNTVNAQEYTDNMRSAYKAYTSSTQKIRENLAKATEGLAAIDEKGMSDKIIEAIEKVSEIRNKQIAAASEYSTQMASFDSTRTSYIKNNGDSRDRFVVVCPSEKNLSNKSDCLKNLSKALIYQIRCRIRLNAYPCLTARFVKGF